MQFKTYIKTTSESAEILADEFSLTHSVSFSVDNNKEIYLYGPKLNHENTSFIENLSKNFKCAIIKEEEIEDLDWVSINQQDFKPFYIEEFFIYPSHYQGQIPNLSIKMDAAQAFGTGEHETTKECIKFITKLKDKNFNNILDLGTGTGILAIAARHYFDCSIDAVDIDPISVKVANENFAANNTNNISCYQSEGFNNCADKYDLIIANILATPLMDLAKDFSKRTNLAILSGILITQADDVSKKFIEFGFKVKKINKNNEWCAILIEK